MAVKQKILIVDDDANIAELISLYLLKECYDTKIVEDGESALHEFKTYQPNLILLDLMLPGIDGYQVCREIRQQSCASSRAIVDAIEAGDSELARQLMHRHISDTGSNIRRLHRLDDSAQL